MITLFSSYDLGEYIRKQEQELSREIDAYDENSILNVPIEDLCDYFESKYRIGSIVLRKDKIYIKWNGEVETQKNDYGRKIKIKESGFIYAIPFEGQNHLFYCQASTSTSTPPDAAIEEQELSVTVCGRDPQKIKDEFENILSTIEKYVGFTNRDIAPFSQNLRKVIKEKIEGEKERILKHLGIVASLGYPIKKSTNAPATYSVPEVKRKILISKPVTTTIPFVPEPALDMENYEAVLKIISNMVVVMERSPHAFKDMDEESLRQHFLVQLNGQFEGGATGETFNYQGRTDIIIKVEGKNVFIAECVIWDGAKSLLDKISQLLGYTSWRDTKTAILIFNRNKDFSSVIAQIPEIVKSHTNYKRQLEYKCESGFRFILHHNQDKNRELTLTILAFDIPK